tara:strand:+ start:904 stop:1587 length:684 start_codon:yes stop_codon:yes gene_type:complete
MAYIPTKIFCKIPHCLQTNIASYLSHPTADLVRSLFKDYKAIFIENTKRDYVLAAKWRSSEMKVYKTLKEKLFRQMKLDAKFGSDNSKIYRAQLDDKRFENIVTKTMLDMKDDYHPRSRNPRDLRCRRMRWQFDLHRDRSLNHMEYCVGLYEKSAMPPPSGIRQAIPYYAMYYEQNPHYSAYFPGYACRVYKKKSVIFNFVYGLNPNARKSWNKSKMLNSIYPNLRF